MKILKKIVDAFFSFKRENFMPNELKDNAYDDNAFPIGCGQTISQPTTIIQMLELLDLQKDDIVLEAGSGSGFNAAVMSKLCKKVYTVELIPELAEQARGRLNEEGVKNVEVIEGNAYEGYRKYAPYNKIIVTAAAQRMPRELENQLKEGGIIVIPIGKYSQTMKKCVKLKGKLECTGHGEYVFVRFVE